MAGCQLGTSATNTLTTEQSRPVCCQSPNSEHFQNIYNRIELNRFGRCERRYIVINKGKRTKRPVDKKAVGQKGRRTKRPGDRKACLFDAPIGHEGVIAYGRLVLSLI